MSLASSSFVSSSPPPVPQAPAPATAVEVVTSLGGSIVSVDTLTLAPASARRGVGFLVAGALLLVMALGTFGYGIQIARADAAAREQWIADKKPSWAFRPTRHGALADGTALVGALAGLALIATGLVRRRAAERTRLRVGQNDGVDIPLADAPPEKTLVAREAGGFVAPIDGLEGDVRFGGTATTLAAMRAAGHVALPLYVGTQVRTQIGHASFFVRGMVAPARTAPAAFGWDRRALAFVGASAVAHLGLWGFLRTVPPDMIGAPTDHAMDETTSVRASTTSREDEVPPPPEDGDEETSGREGAMTAPTAVALQDGTLGERDPNPNPARLRVRDRGMTAQMARQRAIDTAAESGILGSTVFVGPISVADGGMIASGFDDMDITGGFYDGGGQGAPAGSFGWGVRGVGTGCGTLAGVKCEGIASDPFATSGNDGPNYNGPLGDGGPGTRRHVAIAPRAKLLEPTTCGPNSTDEDCLDRDMVRRYVKRHLEKIRYCYEKELLVKAGLEGTVTATFTITGTGNVINSRASGVDETVSSCIAQVVSNISFPKIGNGTGAYPIKYPFQLTARGGQR